MRKDVYMEENIGQLGKTLSKLTSEPAANLAERVILSIRLAERRKAIREEIVFSLASLLSLAGFIAAVRSTIQAVYASGVSEILSLLFSDFQLMVSNWKYFTLSLVESLPAMSLALTLASIAAFLVFISLSARNFKNISLSNLKIKHA